MLLDDDNEVDDCPIADDGEEGLQSIGEEGSGATTNSYGGYIAEGYEGDARNVDRAGTEVLSVKGEGVVVWDIILHAC
jgi:hypothetical protein